MAALIGAKQLQLFIKISLKKIIKWEWNITIYCAVADIF